MLPSGMHNLVNLLLLDIRETCLQEMPRGISKLKGYNGTIFPNWVADSSYQNMTIVGFDQLKSVGMEFYKNKGHHSSLCITPFPSLETLAFVDMASWEEWHLPDSKTFPQLRKLEIRDCPMLKGEMRNQEDRDGRSLDMQLDRDTLSIKGCKSEFKIKISGCSSQEFPEQQQQHKYDLVELQIENSCDSLTSFSLDAFPNLKILKIQQCKNLKSVSVGFISALQCLTMVGCPELVSFAGEGLDAPNLTHLKVTDCVKLEAFRSHMNSLLPCLESLDIKGCSNLCRLPEGGLPPNLNQLLVGNCKKQVRGLSGMGNFHTLTRLTIYGGFEGPKSYPEKGSLPHLPSLTTLHLYCFPNMKTLECNQLLPLTSLKHLLLSYCSNLRNMAGEKLSSSLSSFQIHIRGLLGEH
ncbi:putative disease resistance protein At3g14460 [Arachis hypogaea]|uniref:putative disease resistance protein At3g14460 n=1 Tax=Arachis hypogaea TaxID=3818 RepID=UPI003B21140B